MEQVKLNKENFEVFEFMGGYFGVCEKGSFGGLCVKGGDSANEDDYNEEYISEWFKAWDGSLDVYEF